MADFLNKLDLSDQKYQINGNVRDDNYKGDLLFPMKYFVSFVTYQKSMYFISTEFLKYPINGVRVPLFQIYYIRDTTCRSHKNWLSCVVKYIICSGEIKFRTTGVGVLRKVK